MISSFEILDRILPSLWQATWQATVLIALIFASRALLGRRLSPAWRFALWGVVLARLLAPALPDSPLSLFRLMTVVYRQDASRASGGFIPRGVPMRMGEGPVAGKVDPRVGTDASARPVGPSDRVNRSGNEGSIRPSTTAWTASRILGLGWLVGVSVLSARLALVVGRLRRRSRHWSVADDPQLLSLFERCLSTMGAGLRPVRLLVTEDDLGPAATGTWRPSVLIPRSVLASASAAELEHILLHELAHVRRCDVAIHWLATAACVVHWFNPAVWLASARMRADRELACDAAVLRRLGHARRSAYGETVLKLAAGLVPPRPLPGLVGVFGTRRQLHERIAMIARDTPLGRGWGLASAGLLAAVAVVGLTDAAPPAPAEKPLTTQPQAKESAAPTPERLAELIATLRKRPAEFDGHSEPWTAIRELVTIGKPAVPALIAELDRTTEPWPLRMLGFTLRAIGDPRAVPALIRAIPRTLIKHGSDFGLQTDNAELLAFLQRHDLIEEAGGPDFLIGMPYREILGALNSLTGQRFSEAELHFVNLEGGSAQIRLKRQLFDRLAHQWADWWQENGRRLTDDPAYNRVDLPPFTDEPQAPAPVLSVRPIPEGAKVQASTTRSNMILGPPQPLKYYRTFEDLDTGRELPWPDGLPAPDQAKDEAVAAWAAREGFDLQGIKYRPPGSDKTYYALRALGLRAWRIDNKRFDTIGQELSSGNAPELGPTVGELLMDVDPQTGAYLPENEATFLFVTREGAMGVLQVTGLITELLQPSDFGEPAPEKTNRGFYRGVQIKTRLIYYGQN